MKELTIYIDRLKDGHTEKIQEIIDSSFLDIEEEELFFPSNVSVHGDAYLADDHLILHLKAKTEAKIPCSICNELFPYPIDIDFYHTVPLNELDNPIFDYSSTLRDSILLQVPPFAECHGGCCPERNFIHQFLKKEITPQDSHVQFPFSDLYRE